MFKITAYHNNGYVKFACVRPGAEVEAFVEILRSRGYWHSIAVEPFTPTKFRVAR